MKKLVVTLVAIVMIACSAISLVGCSNEEEKHFTITFDSNGGDFKGLKSRVVVQNQSPDFDLPVPTKEDYNFTGWMVDGEVFEKSSIVKSNITVVAQWDYKYYEVLFDRQNGEELTKYLVEKDKVIDIKLPTPDRRLWNFMGWELNGEPFDPSSKITSDITLTAKWDFYNLKFIMNSDNTYTISSSDSSAFDPLETLILPSAFQGIPITKMSFRVYNVSKLVVPEGIKVITKYSTLQMNEIQLPDSLIEIENQVFAYNENITSIIIPDNVTKMGWAVFDDCKNLHTISAKNRDMVDIWYRGDKDWKKGNTAQIWLRETNEWYA